MCLFRKEVYGEVKKTKNNQITEKVYLFRKEVYKQRKEKIEEGCNKVQKVYLFRKEDYEQVRKK